MIVAASESVDLARILLDLLIVLAAAKLAAEVAERIRIPAVLGEIVAGILDRAIRARSRRARRRTRRPIAVLAELGVLLLLVQVGMEMDLVELRRVGRASMLVAVVGRRPSLCRRGRWPVSAWATTPRPLSSSAPH